MRRWKLAFAVFALAIVGLWVVSNGGLAFAGAGWTQFTGVLSIALMSAGTILSTRPRWLEGPLDGLDKMYRLHKWLGVAGLGVGVVHWLTAHGGGRGGFRGALGGAQTLLGSLHGPAHAVAQPALFALMAFIAIAMIRFIPYKWFAKTHFLTTFIFLALVFHSVVLMNAAYWTTPIGIVTGLLMAAGVLSSIIALFGFIGRTRTVQGQVSESEYYPDLRVVNATVRLANGWKGHRPGQFAFLTTDRSEGAHPFTITTAWDPQTRQIGFMAKELGDHTRKLRNILVEGRPVTVEGPYGCFTFEDRKARHIWVGGGIGIAPFVAKMRELARVPGDKIVDLFHATTEESPEALALMRAEAEAANVRLHILVSPRDGLLDFAKIREVAPDWQSASVWFCGPKRFGAKLRRDFLAAGLSGGDFHQELFEIR